MADSAWKVPEGMRFLSRARAFTDEENAALAADPPITGARYEAGERPQADGTHVVSETGRVESDACPLPGRAAQVQR